MRRAFRTARRAWPFSIKAIVVLPDHLHAVLALPAGEANFPLRWRYIKTIFTQGLIEAGATLPQRDKTDATSGASSSSTAQPLRSLVRVTAAAQP